MNGEKRFMVDVGMNDLPFPMRVVSKYHPEGQPTVANISVSAHILGEFESRWIDKFIRILHNHRDSIGTNTLRKNVHDYLNELNAKTIHVNFDYPYFVEKRTPQSHEKCLVRYKCSYSAKTSMALDKPKIYFKIEVPIITTYPASDAERDGGLFGQLSTIVLEIEPREDIYPEDLVELVDRHALAPIYSFLTEEDQHLIIQKIHREEKSSVVVCDEIKDELAHHPEINSFSVRCLNFGMLHSYSTVVSTEKSMSVPFSDYEVDEI